MKWVFTILFLTAAFTGAAQDSTGAKEPKWIWNGYIKNLETLNFDKDFKENISGNIIHNRINIKWKPSTGYTVAAELRNRIFWGEEVKYNPGFAAQLKNANEKVNLQTAWINKPSLVAHTNIERLYFDYRTDEWNVRAGRQRINWGLTTTWNPNDIFNVYNFLDFDYEERPGVDGAKMQVRYNDYFNVEIAFVHTGKKDGSVAGLRYYLNKWGYDFQAVLGWYNEHPTIGAGWAGSIKEAGFKGELQYYVPPDDSISHMNFVLETDYMFKKGWYVNFSFLFNKSGLHKPVNNWKEVNLKLSPENLMPTRWNFIVTAAKEFTPLFNANMSVLYAPGTNLFLLFPTLQYNIATNIDVNLVWQSFFADTQNKFQAVSHAAFLRMKWSF
jgi:hypothetical protein